MSSYGVYVVSSWVIVLVAIGVRIIRDQCRLRALQRGVKHDR